MLKKILDRMEPGLRKELVDFEVVAAAAMSCRADSIKGMHLLIALLGDSEGVAAKEVKNHGIYPDKLQSTLKNAFEGDSAESFESLARDDFDDPLWLELERAPYEEASDRIHSWDLYVAALRSLGEEVSKDFCEWLEIEDLEEYTEGVILRYSIHPAMSVFDPAGQIVRESFGKNAYNLLKLAYLESRALGLKSLTAEILALTMLEQEGVLSLGIRSQAVDPVPVKENLIINLRRNRMRKLPDAVFDKSSFNSQVVEILNDGALSATRKGNDIILEAHLTGALLKRGGLFSRILTEFNVNVDRLRDFVDSSLDWEEDEETETGDEKLISFQEIEKRLKSSVFGQDMVIDRVMPLIKRLRYGHVREGKPGGVFLFMGLSGTGKTLLAKEIARAVYGSADKLVMLEMGQFKTDISINMFIGAPPGYVGFGEGKLTNGLRDNPESVILFDEVDKADGQVYDALLRFLDEGVISDPAGPVRDGSRCLIILTSNTKAEEISRVIENLKEKADRDIIDTTVRQAALSYFKRPELINRIDELIFFNELTRADYERIFDKEYDKEADWMNTRKNIALGMTDSCRDHLIGQAYERSFDGARVVGKVMTKNVIAPLIDFILKNGVTGPAKVIIDLDSEKNVTFEETE